MTDQQLRLSEREAGFGNPHAQAALLASWLRTGSRVKHTALLIGAYLGQAGAEQALALSNDPHDLSADPEARLKEGARLAHSLGAQASVRSMAAVSRLALESWRVQHPRDRTHTEIVERLEDWILCPCEDHSIRAISALNRKQAAKVRQRGRLGRARRFIPKIEAAREAGRTIWTAVSVMREWQIKNRSTLFATGIEHAIAATSVERVTQVIRDEVVSWLLFHEDPVAKRLQVAEKGSI